MRHLAELNRTGTVLLHWYYHHAGLNQGLVNLAVTAFVNSLVVVFGIGLASPFSY